MVEGVDSPNSEGGMGSKKSEVKFFDTDTGEGNL